MAKESNLNIELAKQFSLILRTQLSEKQILNINEINNRTREQGKCASHEYCNSTEAMYEAFKNVFGRPHTGNDMKLINNAWEYAKFEQFDIPDIKMYKKYELRTKVNGDGHVTLIYSGSTFKGACVSDLVAGGKTSVEKAKAKIDSWS